MEIMYRKEKNNKGRDGDDVLENKKENEMETLPKAWCGSLSKRFLTLTSHQPYLPEKPTVLITHCVKKKKNERMRR